MLKRLPLFLAVSLAACTASSTGNAPPPSQNVSSQSSPARPAVDCGVSETRAPIVRGGTLEAVAATSASDAWAVGYIQPGGDQPLIEHFDGSNWSVSTTPHPAIPSQLDAIAASSQADVWAVGRQGRSHSTTFIEHWNGNQWAIVPSPDRAGSSNQYLSSVSAVSPSDAWAVGASWSGAHHYSTLVEHWAGHRWEIIPSPTITQMPQTTRATIPPPEGSGPLRATVYSVEPFDNWLASVSAVSSADAWAAGAFYFSGAYRPLVEHWDGTRWTIDSPPGTGTVSSIVALASGDVWAFGTKQSPGGQQAVIWHLSGGTWGVVRTPRVANSQFTDGFVSSSSDVWAVGQKGFAAPLLEHWDGAQWREIPAGVSGSEPSFLLGSTLIPGSRGFFTVGVRGSGSRATPLLLRGC